MKKSGKEIPVNVSQGEVFIPDRLNVLNRTQRQAVLATVSDEQPFTSLIAYTLTPDMRGVIFATPKDTTKYRNILKQKRVAILIDTRAKTGSDYLETEAVTIIGTARSILRGKERSELAEIFVKKHPKLTQFVKSPTTALIFVAISHCLHVSGFQRISVWRVE